MGGQDNLVENCKKQIRNHYPDSCFCRAVAGALTLALMSRSKVRLKYSSKDLLAALTLPLVLLQATGNEFPTRDEVSRQMLSGHASPVSYRNDTAPSNRAAAEAQEAGLDQTVSGTRPCQTIWRQDCNGPVSIFGLCRRAGGFDKGACGRRTQNQRESPLSRSWVRAGKEEHLLDQARARHFTRPYAIGTLSKKP